ncbi:putative alkaline shock family protein YloU [Murinocardiopsis flavida]|uniref:Putative alkaline shock family protein YloU n=1 Tax=Murinocardiopsis flavida TaxID=645275 RepID=A0A2P8D4X8_9ACTN|nr:Asp23/Gls24 family envelope stress response protein [Murinocardiopsis flavida]PSK92262.1 putative alkaline shock family protein YloU [Murinocardiopsis flavida]
MSSTAVPVRPVPEQRDPPEAVSGRGRTVVPERVVARIAARAVSEVEGTRGLSGRLGGLVVGGRVPARAHARVSGSRIALRLVIALHYPAPLRSTAREVREHVRRRVEHCTGMTVQHIDIEIGELVPAGRTR